MGYRWYDKRGVAPAFPFGHGLSYGAFAYSDLRVDGRTISFRVRAAAVSKRSSGGACDTPQVYIGYPGAGESPSIPAKVLRHFEKTCFSAEGEAATISYALTDRDVSNWNVESKAWAITRGTYKVYVGASSKDIRLEGDILI